MVMTKIDKNILEYLVLLVQIKHFLVGTFCKV